MKAKEIYTKAVVLFAKKYAEKEANTVCPWFNYQEKLPKGVDKLRKLR